MKEDENEKQSCGRDYPVTKDGTGTIFGLIIIRNPPLIFVYYSKQKTVDMSLEKSD